MVGVTAALIALDPLTTPWLQKTGFRDSPAGRIISRIFSVGNTALAINAAPLSLFSAGLFLGKSYAAQTGLLAGEAAADAEIVAIALKHADRRMRPAEAELRGDFTRTWFRTRNRALDGAGCFPSGHTASAFAIAAVFAARYAERRSVAWAAYGLAGAVGASRINARAHYLSDVFFGAALGYSIGRFVVLQRFPPA